MVLPNNRRYSTGLMAAVACGAGGGLALGAMAGPGSAALGLLSGATLGFLAGWVMDREDRKSSDRTRQLDAVIGITEGSLGAGPVSLEPEPDAEEKRRWLAEWLTPPPPQAF